MDKKCTKNISKPNTNTPYFASKDSRVKVDHQRQVDKAHPSRECPVESITFRLISMMNLPAFLARHALPANQAVLEVPERRIIAWKSVI